MGDHKWFHMAAVIGAEGKEEQVRLEKEAEPGYEEVFQFLFIF